MNLFTKSDGTVANIVEFETGGFKTVPEGTVLLCNVQDCTFDKVSDLADDAGKGEKYLSINLVVVEAGEYRNVTVRQKAFIFGDDKNKDKAIDILSFYNNESGGKLTKIAEQNKIQKIENLNIRHFNSSFAGLGVNVKFGVWEINDKKGNFVRGLLPVGKKIMEEDKNIMDNEPEIDEIPF